MKTTSKKPDRSAVKDHRKPAGVQPDPGNDEEVAVIVDVRNGAEFYMFMIDEFVVGKMKYSVMVPYEPDRVKARDSEIVILRSQMAKNGDQLYVSITDKKELNAAFDVFFSRFEESELK
ncbi:MAG: DUF1292 domain-containing protein [Eubacteriales bacterium]|jgi:hypothetical protein|nr:DUF1292 domain-containing protein [Eubacteriales bacterium]MDD4327744.1 DUF1292 domain-containing protein [Eubacteriales bacterium]MDD4717496.1 DUF1292 domain-containing protein [Eubacteriales bacterium]